MRIVVTVLILLLTGCTTEQPQAPEPIIVEVEKEIVVEVEKVVEVEVERIVEVPAICPPVATDRDAPTVRDTQFRIVPRVGVEHITGTGERFTVSIGDRRDAFTRDPLVQIEQSGGDQVMFKHEHIGLVLVDFKDGRAAIIFTADPRYRTPAGIGVESTRAEMIRAYGEPDRWGPVGNINYAAYLRDQIAFGFEGGTTIVIVAISG